MASKSAAIAPSAWFARLPGWLRATGLVGAGASATLLLSQLLRGASESDRRSDEQAEPTFTPQELRMFERHGIDPERLRFTQTLANLRSGMDLERKMLEDALSGRSHVPASVSSNDLSQYA